MSTPTLELEPGASGFRDRFRLTVISGPHSGMSWTFESPVTLTIGREPPAHLVLDREPALSRRHWRLQCLGTQIQLHDDDSRNGTLVNGLRVIEASLKHGDRFGIGQTELSLEILSEGGEAASVPAKPDLGMPLTLAHEPMIGSEESPSANSTNNATSAPAADVRLDGRISKDRRGEQIGSYTLNELLGSGGMADVYKATRRSDGQSVAIKFLRLDLQSQEKQLQLFAREAGTILQLNHPRVVRGIEFGIKDNLPFLVLEFISTLDLLHLVDTQPLKQKIHTSLWIVRRVLSTTDYLHKQKLVHRDIKPSNLLAYREEHRLKIKLADFGLAKIVENAGVSGLTNEKSVRGTLSFMSPQQFRNSLHSGPSDDLFSIGACLYRFLVGTNPNMLFAPKETFEAVTNANLPNALTKVVLQSIAHQAGDRFRDAASFLKALEPLGPEE